SGSLRVTIPPPADQQYSRVFLDNAPDGFVAVYSEGPDNRWDFYDLKTGEHRVGFSGVDRLRYHSEKPNYVVLSGLGPEHSIVIGDMDTGKVVHRLKNKYSDQPCDFVLSPDGRRLARCQSEPLSANSATCDWTIEVFGFPELDLQSTLTLSA